MQARQTIGSAAAILCLTWAGPAAAFCGFYVKPGDDELRNPATSVVMMREGNRTVLSMRNDYQGPPEDFAMVVPVPEAIQRENVRTLETSLFDKVETLSAPRLVEYWEQPSGCVNPRMGSVMGAVGYGSGGGYGAHVRITAQFAVGEYDVVVLGADDSGALEAWLRSEGYRIPEGAAALLRPYIETGHHFFVAKVDASRVHFEGGAARLSPLRIHYASERFALPVRLGLINSGGAQDLLIHVVARGRYEAANYPNVTAPTNLRVRASSRGRFTELYTAIFDRVIERNPGAVVTEYAWSAAACDPCPGPTLNQQDLASLGADVLGGLGNPRAATLTRLHYRYTRGGLRDDIILREAPPIVGGRGTPNERGIFAEVGARQSSMNAFQTRLAILHRNRPRTTCPPGHVRVHGGWGGPPAGVSRNTEPVGAGDTTKARRGRIDVSRFVLGQVRSLGLRTVEPATGVHGSNGNGNRTTGAASAAGRLGATKSRSRLGPPTRRLLVDGNGNGNGGHERVPPNLRRAWLLPPVELRRPGQRQRG